MHCRKCGQNTENNVLLDQRRDEILELVERSGFASLKELADAAGVSESTVRRDLEHLESVGQVRRTRGGASYVGESLTGFEERRFRASEEKRRVGRKAAALVENSETIILDGGTTTLELAKNLSGKSLQVVTNSLPILQHLVAVPDVELIFLGGYVYPKTGVALGELTVAALKQIHARRLIMSVGGITSEGLFNSNSLLAETERQMMASADEVIVVTDSSKLGHSELAHLCPLTDVDRLVVDTQISEEWQERLSQAGVEVIVADESV